MKILKYISKLFFPIKVDHVNTASRTHSLKTWPEYFWEVYLGRKNFEVRVNDRDYKVRDTVVLQEWDPKNQSYTGKYVTREITYILPGGAFGINEGTVILSLKPIPGFL